MNECNYRKNTDTVRKANAAANDMYCGNEHFRCKSNAEIVLLNVLSASNLHGKHVN